MHFPIVKVKMGHTSPFKIAQTTVLTQTHDLRFTESTIIVSSKSIGVGGGKGGSVTLKICLSQSDMMTPVLQQHILKSFVNFQIFDKIICYKPIFKAFN